MARTEEQNEQMREARKEKIRIEALHQFSMKGLYATRIQDIAEGAGMSQGLLYHYYPSKEAIYIDLIHDALDRTNEAAASVRDMPITVQEKILFSLEELFKTIEHSDRFRQTCRLIAQATNSGELPEEVQDEIIKKRELPYQIMTEIFQQGQEEGSIVDGDPAALAKLYWTSVNGLSIYYATLKKVDAVPDFKLLAAMFIKDFNFKRG
ncbi:MAG: TetR/AcrR family transcriptional regulator [Bacillota bacterium]